MKLLVFAHVPPPHHGQSYMVKLMLDGFGGDRRKRGDASRTTPYDIECYHVDVRLSKDLEDIGDMRLAKLFLLLFYCFRAIWCRFRYGVDTFYFVPAPGKRSALVRDWLVMLLCRPFFKRVILHWHAAGLASWLETCAQIRARSFTYRMMKNVDLSIVLSRYNSTDADKLFPKKVMMVSNGVPDPCPDFERTLLPRRNARLEVRKRLLAGKSVDAELTNAAGADPHIFKVLFLGYCTRQKGMFDALSGVALANQRLSEASSPLRVHLTIAGEMSNKKEQREFLDQLRQPRLKSYVSYIGFVAGEEKTRAYKESDCFCFPTFYYAESFGLVVVEAMAFGLPVLTTRWRSMPEMFPPDYPGLVEVRAPEQVASGLLRLMTEDGADLRSCFLKNFTVDSYLSNLAAAFHSLDRDDARLAATPVPTT
jgi:glycosyltransferase involved in cell wall biosynthesis